MGRRAFVIGIVGATIGAAMSVAAAHAQGDASKRLSVELNKLEEREGSCRAYFIFDNKTGAAYESFKLDLVLFGTDGIIARRMAVEAAPLRAEKRTVKLFDIAGMPCSAIGSVLVNEVLACNDGQGEQSDCIGRLQVGSRVSATLLK